MHLKLFLSVGFVIHATLGSFCMMPMAFAQEMDAMPHEEHMEMDMTPMNMASMIPMSPIHCEHCTKIQQSSNGDHSQSASGCAGHCFSQANNTRMTGVTMQTGNVVVATPPPLAFALVPSTTPVVAPHTTAPPIALHIETTVLRL